MGISGSTARDLGSRKTRRAVFRSLWAASGALDLFIGSGFKNGAVPVVRRWARGRSAGTLSAG